MKVYREYDIELYSEYNYNDDNDFDLIYVTNVEDNIIAAFFNAAIINIEVYSKKTTVKKIKS